MKALLFLFSINAHAMESFVCEKDGKEFNVNEISSMKSVKTDAWVFYGSVIEENWGVSIILDSEFGLMEVETTCISTSLRPVPFSGVSLLSLWLSSMPRKELLPDLPVGPQSYQLPFACYSLNETT